MCTISFAIKIETASKRMDGTCPVVLRIIEGRKPRRIRLGIYARPHQLKDGLLVGVHDQEDKNKVLTETLEKAYNVYDMFFHTKPFDYSEWSEKFRSKQIDFSKSIGLVEYANLVYEKKLRNGNVKSGYDYGYLGRAISKYTNEKEVYFNEFKGEKGKRWLQNFEEHLVNRGLKGFSYLKNLRALYSKAEQGYISEYGYIIEDFADTPFKSVWNPRGYSFTHLKKKPSIHKGKKRLKSLSKEELKKILEYRAQEGSNEEFYLALWEFGYFMSGVNFKDVALMKWSDLRDGKWFYSRSKTNVSFSAGKPITPIAQKIIDKYGNKKGKYVFDILNRGWDSDPKKLVDRVDTFNGYILKSAKKISNQLKLDGYFTPYSVRYSAINIALSNGANSNTVRSAVDQKSLSAIDNYTSDAEIEKLTELMRALIITDYVHI